MGDHSSENYLDQLLNSMHGEETEHPKEQPTAKQVLRDDFEKQLFGEEETKEKAKAKNEEDFLREFEEELLKEDIPEYTESLNQKKQEEKATQIDASLDDLLDNIPQDDFSTGDAAKEEETGFQGKSPLETAIPPDEGDFEVNTLDDAVGTFDSNLPKEEDGELDLSGLSDSDLMDMLSGDQDLSDLGDMLSSDQDGKPLEETDSIGDFARSEMNPQEEVADKIPELTEQEDIPAQAEETASNGKNKKKKKNKKEKKEKEGGFWQKQPHIFGSPFYYIDYCLASVCAMQFKVMMDEDFGKAWKNYYKLCNLSARDFFTNVIVEAGLNSPFEDGCMEKLVDKFEKKAFNR